MHTKMMLIVSVFLLVITAWPSFNFFAEQYYYNKVNSDYSIKDIQDNNAPYPYGDSLIQLSFEDISQEGFEFRGEHYVSGKVVVKLNDTEIYSLYQERGIRKKEGGNGYETRIYFSEIQELKKERNYLAVVANITDNAPFIKDGEIHVGVKPKEQQHFVLLKIYPDGNVEKTEFSYEKRSSYLETKLAQKVTPLAFGHYSDTGASYATFIFPFVYPLLLFFVGIILFIITIIRYITSRG